MSQTSTSSQGTHGVHFPCRRLVQRNDLFDDHRPQRLYISSKHSYTETTAIHSAARLMQGISVYLRSYSLASLVKLSAPVPSMLDTTVVTTEQRMTRVTLKIENKFQ